MVSKLSEGGAPPIDASSSSISRDILAKYEILSGAGQKLVSGEMGLGLELIGEEEEGGKGFSLE